MNTNKNKSVYATQPVGSFLSDLYKVRKHVLTDEDLKKIDLEKILQVFGVESIEVKSLKKIRVIDGPEQIMINDDENLVFNQNTKFDANIDAIETDKTIIGDKEKAYRVCSLLNQESLEKVQKLIEMLQEAELSLKTVIEQQKEALK